MLFGTLLNSGHQVTSGVRMKIMQLSGFMMTKFNLPRVKRLSAQDNIFHHLQKVIFGMSREET